MDDGGDGVEEGEGVLAGLGGNGFGKLRPGERAGRDDRRPIGKRVHPLAD